MQPSTRSRAAGKNKLRCLFALSMVAGLSFVSSAWSNEDSGRWHLVIEPAFMRPAFATPIPGSKKTVVAPAVVRGDLVTYLDQETMERLGVKLDSVGRIARQNASEELAKLEPRYIRDRKGIVQMAVIDSDRPVVAATVLAPDFIKKFEDILGPDLLVAIPNRYRVYVYPALASNFERTADAVLADYEMTPYPVSKEVFRVTPRGLETVGTFEPPTLPRVP